MSDELHEIAAVDPSEFLGPARLSDNDLHSSCRAQRAALEADLDRWADNVARMIRLEAPDRRTCPAHLWRLWEVVEKVIADRDRLAGERDAALAMAFKANDIYDIPEPIAAKRLGRSLRAWLDPVADQERSQFARLILAAAGLAPGIERSAIVPTPPVAPLDIRGTVTINGRTY